MSLVFFSLTLVEMENVFGFSLSGTGLRENNIPDKEGVAKSTMALCRFCLVFLLEFELCGERERTIFKMGGDDHKVAKTTTALTYTVVF